MVSPAHAHAGFFSDILKFFGAGNAEAVEKPSAAAAAVSMPLLGSQSGSVQDSGIGGPVEEDRPALSVTQDSALVADKNPMGTVPSDLLDRIVVYTVQEGDTPLGIAQRYGVSLNTLLWANNIRNPNVVKIGDSLVILPVSGVQYDVKKGDTIEAIAKRFKGDAGEIMSFNGLPIGEPLEIGTAIIIPDGDIEAPPSVQPSSSVARFAALPEISGYYLRPIVGGRNVRATKANPRGIHGLNGVDLSLGSCGGPVLASANGTIILARYSGWNGGYGKYLVIAHPNGTQTMYAHLSSVLISTGQFVGQGTQVGTIGSTGNSTGCHVHFEIRGARNPF